MTSDQIQEVIQYLVNLGETMATGAYQLALQRVVFMGVQNLVGAGLFFLGLLGAMFAIRKGEAMKKVAKDDDWEWYIIGGWASVVGTSIVIMAFLVDALDCFLYPEWNAIQMILNFGQ